MVVKGTKRSSSRSSNKHGSDNIISSGSGIAVADGQCMMIVEQGKVVEVCADPGEYTYDASTEPSIFSGSLGDGIRKTFDTIGKRFAFGGDTGKDQRVYYFNTKELVDNKFGTVIRSRSGLWIQDRAGCGCGCEVSWCLFLQDRGSLLFIRMCVEMWSGVYQRGAGRTAEGGVYQCAAACFRKAFGAGDASESDRDS